MVSSTGILPPGMVGGGAFDIHGNCKGMIEGVVQKPGSTIVSEKRCCDEVEWPLCEEHPCAECV